MESRRPQDSDPSALKIGAIVLGVAAAGVALAVFEGAHKFSGALPTFRTKASNIADQASVMMGRRKF
jgi:hypothetical protein